MTVIGMIYGDFSLLRHYPVLIKYDGPLIYKEKTALLRPNSAVVAAAGRRASGLRAPARTAYNCARRADKARGRAETPAIHPVENTVRRYKKSANFDWTEFRQ